LPPCRPAGLPVCRFAGLPLRRRAHMGHLLLVRTITCGGKWLASAWM
jgi:hypothetical protein